MSSIKNIMDSQQKPSKKKQEGSYENIIVGLRLRPNNDALEKICQVQNDKSVIVKKTNERFQFDNVFEETATSFQIFSQVVKPIVSKCLDGFNGSVCAYGQTSSGKTYTMKGSSQEPGLIQLSVDYIFKQMQKMNESHHQVKVSYIEIYNENIYDLLERDMQELKPVQYKEYHWESINSLQAFEEIFKYGEVQRHFGETKMNDNSSRSHVILQLLLETRQKSPPFLRKTSQLNLVDLAGSEALSKTQAEGQRRKEGFLINKSLLSLQSVVMRLKENKKDQFVNFRDSKLTRILKQSLSGNSITAFLLTISQHIENHQESINTMKFGIAAGALKNLVTANESCEEENAQVELQIEQIELLKNESSVLNIENRQLAEQLISKDLHIEDLKQEIDYLNRQMLEQIKEIEKLNLSNNQLVNRYDELSEKHKDLTKEMKDVQMGSVENYKLFQQYQKIVEDKGLLSTKLMVESITQTEIDVYNVLEQENQQLKEQYNQIQSKFSNECNQLKETIQNISKTKDFTPVKKKMKNEENSFIQRSLQKNNEYLETLISLSNLQTLHIEQTKQNMILRNALDKRDREYFELEQSNCQLHRAIFELQEQLCDLQQNQENENFWKQNMDVLKQDNLAHQKKRIIMSPSKEEYKRKLQRYEQRMHVYEKDIAKQQRSLELIQRKKQDLEQFSHHLYQACVENNVKII